MLIAILVLILVSILYLSVFSIYFHCKTNSILKRNQEEWDNIKKSSNFCNVIDEIDAYVEYVDNLQSHFLVGKCFPKR